MNSIIQYYERDDEENRFSRVSRRIEFLTTTHVLETHLPSGGRLLEVGAGPGVYSFHYAERGYQVTALDLTPKHVELLKKRSIETGIPIEAFEGNAVDLSRFATESYDAVLLLGPLYHLTSAEDRDRCLQEALRVLKPDGVLTVAYINKYHAIPMLATRAPSFIRTSR